MLLKQLSEEEEKNPGQASEMMGSPEAVRMPEIKKLRPVVRAEEDFSPEVGRKLSGSMCICGRALSLHGGTECYLCVDEKHKGSFEGWVY